MALRPLQGFVVGITAARRWEEQAQHLTSRGAVILHAPALVMQAEDPEGELRRTTEELVRRPPDLTILLSGAGTAAWISVAESFGAGDDLRRALRSGVVMPRGAKAVAACVEAGLALPSHRGHDRLDDVLRAARATGSLAGLRVAVQLAGGDGRPLLDELRREGADVIPVRVYRCGPSQQSDRVHHLVDAVCRERVHAVTFTSTAAVSALFARAVDDGRLRDLRRAFTSHVAAVSIGPATTDALLVHGATSAIQPLRPRLGAMIAVLVEHLRGRARRLRLLGHDVVLQGSAVLIENTPCWLTEQERAVLETLARAGGHVVTKSQLLHTAFENEQASEHAVEVAVARLRRRLGPAGASVETVFRRGYRLVVDEPAPYERTRAVPACEPNFPQP